MLSRLFADAHPGSAGPSRAALALGFCALAGAAAMVVWGSSTTMTTTGETGLFTLLAPGATLLAGAIGGHAGVPESADFDPARARLLTDEIGAETMAELVEVFLGDAKERVAAMLRLVAAGERKPLERAAHSIKSSAATFGFERIAGLACEIEGVAATAPATQLRALVEAVVEALGRGSSAWRAINRWPA